MTAVHNESELVKRARAGDPEAFVALCQAHRAILWRVVASVAGPSDTEDLAQEAIVRAYRRLASFRGEAPFAAWLCRIAINAAHDYQKSAWRRRIVSMPVDDDGNTRHEETPHLVAERREMQHKVRQAVANLREAHRVPIWLHYFEGFTLAEVARLEGLSESTIRSRLHAGLNRLAPQLMEYLPAAATIGDRSRPKGCET